MNINYMRVKLIHLFPRKDNERPQNYNEREARKEITNKKTKNEEN